MLFLFPFLLSYFALSADYDVQVIDQLIEHHRQTIKLGELAQKQSQNLILKKLARRIIRDERRDIKRMSTWRSSYYEGVPEVWTGALKTEKVNGNGSEFDRAFVDRMIENHAFGIELLKGADQRATKDFLREFAQKEMKDLVEEKDELLKLKKSMM